ncbi:uncharacterized protein LOC117169753 [Belonocnema kinseyi]|uniref:uncharacterized protein LOC117169753 n=1 Tax=Belonocnema kinseyi TaxID=2817044 RepID=UPI00143D73C1|nr:uncharacterized protein LOC117169753 [Belonocnema kinseyi]
MSVPTELTKKRGALKTRVTCFRNYITNLKREFPDESVELEDVIKFEINDRLDKIRENFALYEEIQEQIDGLTDDPQETIEYRTEIEDNFFRAIAEAKRLLSQGILKDGLSVNARSNQEVAANQAGQQVHQQSGMIPNNQPLVIKASGLQLPQIELPKFNGELSEWLGFRDTFESLIHNNQEITQIEKFHYLNAALKDSAAQVIESLEFSAINYKVAWDALCSRFNNKRLLIQNHIKTIFNTDQITSESSVQIRKMLDNLNKHIRALATLGQSTDNWDSLLIYLLASKLDTNTARAWEKERTGNEIPSLNDFKNFLKGRANLLETLEINNLKLKNDSKSKFENKGYSQNRKSFLAQKISCALCKEEHHIQNCPTFLSLTTQERAEKARSCKICLNCLRPGHFQRECRSSGCKNCKGRHNTLLHFETSTRSNITTPSEPKEKIICSASTITSNPDDGVLSTASVLVTNINNEQCSACLLLDSGSQCNLITYDLCEALKLKKSPIDVSLGSISESPLTVKHKCEIEIQSQTSAYKIRVSCLVVSKIRSEVPKLQFNAKSLKIPLHINLADPQFDKPGTIDIFLGNAVFWSLICVGQIKLNNEGLILQKTRLGWMLAGPMPDSPSKLVSCNAISKINIESQLRQFWELEEFNLDKRVTSVDEGFCEEFFVKTLKRDNEGRFIVTIPLKRNPQCLGDSREIAKRRLLNLESRLGKQTELREDYSRFIREYIDLKHMKKVDNEIEPITSYYFPHHCIVRPQRESTKIRVVFNGSAESSSGVSLYDLQIVGPNIQSDIFSIILRFRKHKFVIGGDIEKMYRQVQITPEQHSLQRILWRFDVDKPIDTYELTTVTYGTAAASFLAIRCVNELAHECEKTDPEIAKIIRQDFYVDDLLTGADSIKETASLAKRLKKILATALNDQSILRHVFGSNAINIELHGFSDASQEAYGGCVYIRSQDKFGNVAIRLLCAKLKVSPLKTQTIPRLELCGAVCLAKLIDKAKFALDTPIQGSNYWTDSSIILDWIKKQPEKMGDVFVSNRVSAIAYCKRFTKNCKLKESRITGPLNTKELRESLLDLAKLVQQVSFQTEINALKNGETIVRKKGLKSLAPFLDENEMLRVGGRLSNSNFKEDKKYPILIHSHHTFTKLLFQHEHVKLFHAPPQLLLSSIRETFWPIGGRNLARKTVHDCIRCSRMQPKSITPRMGNLPSTRISESPPFCNAGVHYADPFSVKDRKGRGCKVTKAYVCLFVCFSTKALHLELVSDATTDALLAALRRFVSRRGKPANIHSDNGTNFVGANNELRRLGDFLLQKCNSLNESIANTGIQWHFIPAYKPHFGGIWEAGVKSVKHHLKRVAGEAILTFEEFATLLTQIEAILNSRPLTPLSSDPNDLNPLTPAHFLIGRTFSSLADPDLSHVNQGRLSNWQRIQQLQQHMWKRWSKEYISELQRRTKWQEPFPELNKNTLVLLKDDNLPPSAWKLGRITEVHPGKDGIARIASVKTSKGIVRRSFTKLCPLPICN